MAGGAPIACSVGLAYVQYRWHAGVVEAQVEQSDPGQAEHEAGCLPSCGPAWP